MRLHVVIDQRSMGVVETSPDGRVSFTYEEAWRTDPATFPLSLSMPKVAPRYGGGVVSNWLWNLLPENGPALQRIADDTNHGWPRVSARNPLALLAKIGEDCAGAVQLVRPERLGNMPRGEITWLDEAEIAVRLRELRENRAATGRQAEDKGQFSLAGAQTKTALHLAAGRWGLPSGRIPTTHILKPPIPGLRGQVENEHFCLRLAAALGLPSVRTEVATFETERAIVVERYDRLHTRQGRVTRIHQEDMCQALRTAPSRKYQSEKGPGAYDIVTKVLATSADAEGDRAAFVGAMAMNYVIVGTDAHAKNFSIVFGRGGAFRLAPFYDVNSSLPYAARPDECQLSMSVDGRAVVGAIQPRHWGAQARACGLPEDTWVAAVRDMLARVPDLSSDALRACRAAGLGHEVLEDLSDALASRCHGLARMYGVEAVGAGYDPG